MKKIKDAFYLSLSFHGIYEFLQEYLVCGKIENKHCCLETINKTQGGGGGKRESFKRRSCRYTAFSILHCLTGTEPQIWF